MVKKREFFFGELKQFARVFCRNYFSAVKIVRETMKIEKAKLIFSRARQLRRWLLHEALSKLVLHKACPANRLKDFKAVITATTPVGKVLTEQQQRQKFIQKIANTILQSRRE